MTYSRLLLVLLIVLVALSIPTVVILSQGSTRQVGSAKCDLYTEQSGVRCARINCDVTGYNLPGQSTIMVVSRRILRSRISYIARVKADRVVK